MFSNFINIKLLRMYSIITLNKPIFSQKWLLKNSSWIKEQTLLYYIVSNSVNRIYLSHLSLKRDRWPSNTTEFNNLKMWWW